MNITELFKNIQHTFNYDNLNGDLELNGNCIIWSYTTKNDGEIKPKDVEDDDVDEDNDFGFFYDIVSDNEVLDDIYQSDFTLIKEILDELDQLNHWNFSKPDVLNKSISFKIF